MKVYVVNESTVLTDTDVADAMPAFQHFALLVNTAWGHVATTLVQAKPVGEAWQIVILDDSDQAGALGYHDFTPGGRPIAKVFAKTDKTNGYSWTVTLTHELAEMIADPWINEAVQASSTRFYAKEVGDPVEADALGFTYDGLLLSDFATPAWFQPGAKPPFDHAGHCTTPLQVLAGGYAQYHDATGWHQVNAQGAEMAMDADDARLRNRWK